MSALDQLYQQVILDHARERHGAVELPVEGGLVAGSGENRQFNPLCGDDVRVRVHLGPQQQVIMQWTGQGCSISQASVSVLHDLVTGVQPSQAQSLVEDFRAMIRSQGADQPDDEVLGDAVAFAGVGKHANRVKCAMIGWAAFEAALGIAQSGSDAQLTSDSGPHIS